MKTIQNIKIIGRSRMSFEVVEEGLAKYIIQTMFAPFDRSNNQLEKQARDYLISLNN